MPKLTPETVLAIRERTARFKPWNSEPMKVIAAEFGVSIGCIHKIITRQSWRDAALIPPAQDRRRKLSEEQVREIRRQRADGDKLEVIALNFGVSFSNVRSITLRQIWKHVA